MTPTSKTITLHDADIMIDNAQQQIETILADLANSTGLDVGPVEATASHRKDGTGIVDFTVRIWASMPHGKG